MTWLQLMAFIDNTPLNIKNSMRCAKKCSFIILATAISGMPTPEICFFPGQFRLTILPQEHHGESLRVCELNTQPSNWEADTTTGLSPPQRNLRRQCLGVSRCYGVQLGRYWETKDTRKKIKLALTIYRDFIQNCFIGFWKEEQYKPKTTGPLTFLVRGRVSSLSFVQRTFDWDGWNGFVWRGRCRDWGTIGPQVSMPVNRGRRKNFRSPWKNILNVV